MKKFLCIFTSILITAWIYGQSATNVIVTSIVQLNNGTSFTNTVANSNTNVLAAATNAMKNLNLTRASQDPPKAALTNLSQFAIEVTKLNFKQFKDEYDYKIVQDLNAALPTMSDTDKDKFRQLQTNSVP